MKCKVTVDSSSLTVSDMEFLNEGEAEIRFFRTDANNFLPPGVIFVLIELGQNIGYNAAYDALKYALGKLMAVFTGKKSERKSETKIEIACGEERYSISCSFELTEVQKDKLVDAAAKKLLGE